MTVAQMIGLFSQRFERIYLKSALLLFTIRSEFAALFRRALNA
jgi:hypothetical protein